VVDCGMLELLRGHATNSDKLRGSAARSALIISHLCEIIGVTSAELKRWLEKHQRACQRDQEESWTEGVSYGISREI
jgi:hypothetical protein